MNDGSVDHAGAFIDHYVPVNKKAQRVSDPLGFLVFKIMVIT